MKQTSVAAVGVATGPEKRYASRLVVTSTSNPKTTASLRTSMQRKVVFAGLAALLFVFGGGWMLFGEWGLVDWPSLLGSSAIALSLASCGWLPQVGAVSVVVLFFSVAAFSPLGPAGLAVYVVAADLFARKKYGWAVGTMTAALIAQLNRTGLFADEFPIPILVGCAIAVIAGLLLRRRVGRDERALRAAETSEDKPTETAESVRNQTAAILHDTVARDLVEILVYAQDLADNPQKETADIGRVEAAARSGLRHLQDLTAPRSPSPSQTPIGEVIAEGARMLESHGQHLQSTIAAGTDAKITGRSLDVLGRVIAEAIMNVVKYAPAGATAQLTLTVEDGTVELVISNPIAQTPRADKEVASTRLGLKNANRQISEIGGSLYQWQVGDTWILNVHVPSAGRPSESDDTAKQAGASSAPSNDDVARTRSSRTKTE